MRKHPFPLTVILLGFCTFALCIQSAGFVTGLVFVPFALGPLFVTLLLAYFLEGAATEMTLTISSILYTAWFTYVYLDVFFIHPDALSVIGLVVVGLYSLPVMAIFWIASFLMRKPRGDEKSLQRMLHQSLR